MELEGPRDSGRGTGSTVVRGRPRGLGRRLLPLLAVLLLGVLHAGLAWRWMSVNGFLHRPMVSDAIWYQVDTLRILQGYQQGGVEGWVRATAEHDRPHPPLLPVVGSVAAAFVGEVTPATALLTTGLFGLLMLAGIYRLSRHFGGPWFAVSVAAVASGTPSLLWSWAHYFPQMPMTAAVLWALAALLGSDALRRTGASLATGFWAGTGMMIKVLAPAYLFGSSIAMLVVGLRTVRPKWIVWKNVLLVLCVAVLVSAPWFVLHYRTSLDYFRQVTGDGGQTMFSGGVDLWSVARWTYYPRFVYRTGFGPMIAWLLAPSLFWGLWRLLIVRTEEQRARRTKALVLIAGAVGTYVVITIGQVAGDSFYMLAYIPMGAALLVGLIQALRFLPLRIAAGLVVAAACLLNTWHTQKLIPDCQAPLLARDVMLAPPLEEDTVLAPAARLWIAPWAGAVGAGPNPAGEDWPNDRYAGLILAHSQQTMPTVFIYTHQEPYHAHPYIGRGTLFHAGLKRGVSLLVQDPFTVGQVPPERQPSIIAESEFVIHDHRILPLDHTLEEVRNLGLEAEMLSDDQVTPLSRLTLLALRPAGTVPRYPPGELLELADTRRHLVHFEGGWRLLGSRVEHAGEGRLRLTLLFDGKAPAGKAPPLMIRLREADHVSDPPQLLSLPHLPIEGRPLIAVVSRPFTLAAAAEAVSFLLSLHDPRGHGPLRAWSEELEVAPDRQVLVPGP